MKTDPDDATRLLALLVAICGPEIASYRPKIEALVAALKANAKLKTGETAEGISGPPRSNGGWERIGGPGIDPVPPISPPSSRW